MDQGEANDLVALFSQQANQQIQDLELNVIGHVIEHDQKSNMVRCMLPTRRAFDENGEEQIMETGWMQLATPIAGNGFGLQYALKGGATKENPEKGEAVQVSVQHRPSGLMAVAGLVYNDEMKPPGAGKDDQESEGGEGGGSDPSEPSDNQDDIGTEKLEPGEIILRHESGTLIKLKENGDLLVKIVGKLILDVKDNVEERVREGDRKTQIDEGDVITDIKMGDRITTLEVGDDETNLTAGDFSITTDIGDISADANGNINLSALEGDIGIESVAGNIAIAAAMTIELGGQIINLISSVVNVGAGVLQKLLNLNFLALFNAHSHPTAMGPSGPPTEPAIPGVETTVDLEAS